MNFKYWGHLLLRMYVWLIGGYVLLLLAIAVLYWLGVQANYENFIIFWGVFVLATPFVISRFGGLPYDPRQLFPNLSAEKAMLFSFLLSISTTVIALGLLLWAAFALNIR